MELLSSGENAYHINSTMVNEKGTEKKLGHSVTPSKEQSNVNNNSIFINDVCSPQSVEKSLRIIHEPVQELQLEWIEEEMARVCGEESANSDTDSKCSPLKSSPILGESKPGLSIKEVVSITNGSKSEKKEMTRNPISKSNIKPIDWRLVRMKHEALLEKKLKKAEETGGAEKRAKLERRFRELFGEPTLSPDIKRKDEIAAFTVKHLMPMYKKQKIASKDLFKKLAKHISTSVLDKVKTPGEDDVRSKVSEYFRDGKCVSGEEDIYCI